MSIPDIYNPKKWIGAFGRKYGGKPFQMIRKYYYNTLSLVKQCYEVWFLLRGKYAPDHKDRRFYEKYYRKDFSKAGPNGISGIICMLDGRRFHGGLTDRIRGILSTYEEAKKRNIDFHIFWKEPFSLENYLIPNKVDWRIQDKQISYNNEEAFPVIIEDETNLQSYMRTEAAFGLKYFQLHVYSNSDRATGRYKELYNELFRPSEKLQNKIDEHVKSLGNKFWSFTFRFLNLLGDFKEWQRKELSEDESENLINEVVNAMKTEMNKLPAGYKVLVTSDSKKFLDIVKDVDSRIYVVPGDVKNIDLLKGVYEDAWMKTFIDHSLLMRSERVYLVRTGLMYKSGFPKFAAEVGGKEFIDLHF